MNRVVLIGRTTKDLELRKTNTGTTFVQFNLVVNKRSQNPEQQTDYINCKAFNKTAELIVQYVKKGHRLGVEGRISTGSYDGADGKKIYTTEVIVDQIEFLESKGASENRDYSQKYSNTSQSHPNNQTNDSSNNDYQPDAPATFDEVELNVSTDDLPF